MVVGGDNFSLIFFCGLYLVGGGLCVDNSSLIVCGSRFSSSGVGGSVDLDSGTPCTTDVLDSDTFIGFSLNTSS